MAETKTVKLGMSDYRATFDPEIDGVGLIRPAAEGGTEVPEKHVEAVQEAANNAKVKIRKM